MFWIIACFAFIAGYKVKARKTRKFIHNVKRQNEIIEIEREGVENEENY